MNKENQVEVGLKSETGELYMLNKKQRILLREVLSKTLESAAGQAFVAERFGEGGLELTKNLLKEMGGEIKNPKEEKAKPGA